MRYTKSVPAAVLALLVTAACDSSDLVVVDPGPGGATPNRAAPQASVRTPDDEFARASRAEAPGFAGFYLHDDGTPVIRLVDGTRRGEVQRYLAQALARARRGRNANAPRQPVFLPAAYDFAQLKEWSNQLVPLLSSRGDVYLIDVDEVGNRVSLGVADATAVAAVRAEAARLGIPANAVHVRTQARPEQRVSVRDWHSSLYGGIQITKSVTYYCTLGFNATRVATEQSIFVTASHCTPTRWAYDGDAIYQNTVTGANHVGNEVVDVGKWDCGGTCRWSDAVYIGYNGSRGVSQGVIARTSWAWRAPGGLVEHFPSYRIVARYSGFIPVGEWLDKTGRSSGSTYGQVTASCVTLGELLCQDVSNLWSQPGDSGSPVHFWVGGSGSSEYDTELVGIMWGGPADDYNTTYSSSLWGIENDMGALTNLCAPGYGC